MIIYDLVVPIYTRAIEDMQVIETSLDSIEHRCLASGESYNGWHLFMGPFEQSSQATMVYQQYKANESPDIFDISGPMFDYSNGSISSSSQILSRIPMVLLFAGIIFIVLTHGKVKK